ncbi:MAG: ATP-binding protein, partial [Thiotrichaceae bacterium]
EPNLSEQLQFGLQQSREQAQRMQHIIEDMLALSRLENQEDAPSRGQPVKFPQLLHKQIKAMQDTLAEGSHDLQADIDETLDINGIQADLISVVTNLLANAVKHTPIGTQIQVVWRRNDQAEACLSVIDNGTGIPEKHLAHLAERFYRVDAGRSREKGGTGLGLAIVKHAVQAHDGELKIESKPGRTEFRACFPSSRWVLQENAA